MVALVNQSDDGRFSFRVGFKGDSKGVSPGVWTPVFVRDHGKGRKSFPHHEEVTAAYIDLLSKVLEFVKLATSEDPTKGGV